MFLQLGIQRWRPSAITKNSTKHEIDNVSINVDMDFYQMCVKMILALSCKMLNEENLNGIVPILCHNCPCMKPI